MAEAINGDDGVDVTPSRDYRGVPVIGAWRWLPQLGIGVVTQVDASEATGRCACFNPSSSRFFCCWC